LLKACTCALVRAGKKEGAVTACVHKKVGVYMLDSKWFDVIMELPYELMTLMAEAAGFIVLGVLIGTWLRRKQVDNHLIFVRWTSVILMIAGVGLELYVRVGIEGFIGITTFLVVLIIALNLGLESRWNVVQFLREVCTKEFYGL
jgi:hypothetical protein